MDFEQPFWDEKTPIPKENECIDRYFVLSNLYSTRYAYYFTCQDSQDHSIKLIKFIKLTENKIPNIQNEINISKLINNPNIVELQNVFRHSAYICLVFPYSHRQTLYDFIKNQHPNGIPENIASNLMYQMLKSLNYLHSLNIWHRNIKPENFLVSDDANPKIYLFNFEFAAIFNGDEKGTQYLGSLEFMAPEIFKKSPYDSSIDIWSLGITLFVMLTGQFPFPKYDDDKEKFLDMVSKGQLNFDILEARKITKEAIELIHKMCKFNSSDRITIAHALQHAWISNNIENPNNEI